MVHRVELSNRVILPPSTLTGCTSREGARRLRQAQLLWCLFHHNGLASWPLIDAVVASETCCHVCAGHRSRVYSLLFSCATAAAGVGPLFATAIFMATGNRWTQVVSPVGRLALFILQAVPDFAGSIWGRSLR